MKKLNLVLGLSYIFALLIAVMSSWGVPQPGYTVGIQHVVAWCISCVAPFAFGYFAGYERNK